MDLFCQGLLQVVVASVPESSCGAPPPSAPCRLFDVTRIQFFCGRVLVVGRTWPCVLAEELRHCRVALNTALANCTCNHIQVAQPVHPLISHKFAPGGLSETLGKTTLLTLAIDQFVSTLSGLCGCHRLSGSEGLEHLAAALASLSYHSLQIWFAPAVPSTS